MARADRHDAVGSATEERGDDALLLLVVFPELAPVGYSPDPKQAMLSDFHNHQVMQAGAYQNAAWVVGWRRPGARRAST